jgi:imidazolonepropionase-like amidohydrolase
MNSLRGTFAGLLIVGSLFAQTRPVAFTHVTVIDTNSGALLADQTVLLKGNAIAAVGKTGRVSVPAGSRKVDGRGKFLIPGLWDMHVHFRGGVDLIPANESWLSLFVANGITGVREMGGDLSETVFQWRREIRDGTRFGPRIVTSGPKLDGPIPTWPGSIPVYDPESARAAVRTLKAMGADFVKIYFSRIARETYQAVLDEAKAQGLPVAGHLAIPDITPRFASDSGQKCIEHAGIYVLPGASPREDEIDREYAERRGPGSPINIFEYVAKIAASFDARTAADLAAHLARNRTWVVPTLAAERLSSTAATTDYSSDPRRKYILAGMWQSWDPIFGRRLPPSLEVIRSRELVYEKERELLPILQRAGVGLLAGSDSGASNNYTFPGWTLHQELELLVASGLTPLAALQTATRNPAVFLDEPDKIGSVAKGKAADLVLLDANPLDDIRNTRKIDSVVLHGKLLTRTDLDAILAAEAVKAAKP